MRKLICITMAIVVCVTAFAASSTVSAAPSGVDSTNLLSNGSFEEGDFSPTGSPDHWATGSASHVADFTWDETQSFDGNKSVKISADQLDDAFWGQTILVMPHTDYQLSGYIKTENVRYGVEPVQMGANLSIIGSWDDHSQPLFGSNDWTYVSFEFNSGERSQLTFAARLGFWAGTTTGTAWFDNLRLIPTSPISLQCDPSYPEGFFRACYYRGTDPYQGTLISMQEENPLGSPVPDRTFGIDHDWETGTMQNISAIWRGHLYFNAGRYQFTTFARDGVRLYIDEMRLLDQWTPDEHWYRFGTVIELTEGFHDVRVEWFTAGLMPDATLLRLHWDRVPASPEPHQVTPMVINVFLLTKQDICIVGNPWVSGERVAIYNPDGTEYRVWQREDAQDLPRTLRPSDPALNNYAQVECFSFGYLPDEIPHVLAEVDKFKGLIKNWSGGDIEPEIRLSQLEAEVNLGRIGTSWWIAPWEMAPFAASSMTTESDFAIVLSSAFDMNTRRSYEIFGCGGSYGAASYTMGGTGYSWVPCADDLIILHEWEHQFTSAVRDLLQFASIYPDIQTFPESGYPACGMADPDIFKWFPDSHDWSTDPDSPWCGMTDNVGISELHLFGHYDASLSHYPLGRFTGNHCNDGVQDFGESDIDKGSNCPAKAPQETIARQPSDDGWIQLRSSGNHGDDKQLKIGKNSRVAYLKFDLQDVRGDVTNAQLILTAPQTQEATVSLNAVADTAWQEETLTGKNAPPLGESIDSVMIPTRSSKTIIRWDVTEFLNEAIANGAREGSFALVLTDGKQIVFSSSENQDSDDMPLLVISVE